MKLLKIFLLACMVMVTGIYAAEGSQSNILWHNSTTGAVKFMPINNMIPEDTLSVVDSSNLNLLPRGIADFTGDNEPDILFHNQNSGNLRIWKMYGAIKGENILVLGSSNTNLMIAGVGDFDQDGDNDIATFNTNSGALRMWVMDGAVRVDNVLVLTGANTNLVPRGAGDMDGDGIPDIVLRNNNSGAVRIWTMNSDFTRKGNEYLTGSSNTNLELRGVVDINGDGNNDILNYNTNTGMLRAWLMDGNFKITENAEIVQEADLDWSVRGGYLIPIPQGKVTKLIDSEGGTIELSSGFAVTFPEGAIDDALLVSVENTTLPGSLPGDITASSPAYKIDANNIKLAMPATITFSVTEIDPSTQEGEVGIYRWDGTQWTFAGGGLKDNVISTSVKNFSTFIVGTGRGLHFPVEFDNFWTGEPGVVSVDRYILAHPDIDAPIAVTNGAAVFPPPNNWPTARMYLPQGSYSFCFEWSEKDIIEDKIDPFYAFTGSVPSDPAASLNENSSYVVPAYVLLRESSKYPGYCPVPQQWFGDEKPVEDAEASDFVGTFNVLDPERTSAEYRAILTFNTDGTFTGKEWYDGDGPYDFSGTWSFDSETMIFTIEIPGGGTFSGQVVGSIQNFIIGGTWNTGAAGQIQLYR